MKTSRKLAAEAMGTAFLLCAVVGSGIMAERLSQGNAALALLTNAVATGAALVALILMFGPISGAHFNPVVTLASAFDGSFSWSTVPGYVVAQISGALAGVAVAHVMFALPLYSVSHRERSGLPQLAGEFVATFGLLLLIASCRRFHSSATAYAVGAYITGAYWFTSSTSFANPAVTLARCVTNTFAGIRPMDAPGFLIGQFFGAFVAILVFRWMAAAQPVTAKSMIAASRVVQDME